VNEIRLRLHTIFLRKKLKIFWEGHYSLPASVEDDLFPTSYSLVPLTAIPGSAIVSVSHDQVGSDWVGSWMGPAANSDYVTAQYYGYRLSTVMHELVFRTQKHLILITKYKIL